MWQDALMRCGLPVDGGELFEIWLNGSEANGAGEPETATETANGVELTWIEAELELRAHIDRRGNRRVAAERRHEERRQRARDAHARELAVHAGRKAVFVVYSGGRIAARKPQRLAQLRRGRNGDKQRMGAHHAVAAPFMALRDESCGRMTAMHLIPCGDWRMSLQNRCDNEAYLRIGVSERLCVELKPGGSPPSARSAAAPIRQGTPRTCARGSDMGPRACTTSNSRWQ